MRNISLTRNNIVAASARIPWRDFQFVLLGAVALLIMVATSDVLHFLIPLRWVLGLAFVLFVPGYCLTEALFPQAEDLDSIARGGLSFGLSVATIPVLVLILNILPWGIHPWPILFGVYSEIAVFISVAIWRRLRLASPVIDTPKPTWHLKPWWQSLSPGERPIFLLIAGTLSLVTIWIGWMLLFPSPEIFTTEFFILGKAGLAEGYPREATVGDPLTVTMGITNREQSARSYRVEVWASDSWNPDRRALVSQVGPMTVQPGQDLEQPVTWRMPVAGNDQQVEFLLFTGDNPQPYRRLRLLLNVVNR